MTGGNFSGRGIVPSGSFTEMKEVRVEATRAVVEGQLWQKVRNKRKKKRFTSKAKPMTSNKTSFFNSKGWGEMMEQEEEELKQPERDKSRDRDVGVSEEERNDDGQLGGLPCKTTGLRRLEEDSGKKRKGKLEVSSEGQSVFLEEDEGSPEMSGVQEKKSPSSKTHQHSLASPVQAGPVHS
ncbi:hypothetical protein XELAEV_18041027mg [Xenopus laevis]|uniref:Uncharacterized protein n=1 Tax=Xenopus laevis TaxID=8355 RepID=A0A974H4P3_XENLA|nr:hypothetical protein XELAEV_18041027mg [Xenopus laevis]